MVKYSSLTPEQQDEIANLCKDMVSLSEKARREGLLALEDGLDDIPSKYPGKNGRFLFALGRLTVDGTDENIMSSVAENYTASSALNDFEILSFTLIKTWVKGLYTGEPPKLMEKIFMSYIGFDDEEQFLQKTGFSKWEDDEW